MRLTLNERGQFIWWSDGRPEATAIAQEAGLACSLPATKKYGFPVYFTDVPYAVLHLREFADDAARAALADLSGQWEASVATDADISIPCPSGRAPRPFQRASIAYGADRKNVLFGDAPGLGKTVQAILLANLKGYTRVLVVCPATVRLHWQKFVREWSTIPKVLAYPVLKSSDGIHPKAHYVITSYEVARDGLWPVIMGYEWDLLIIDEGHYLKTPDSLRTRALFGGGVKQFANGGIASRCGQIAILTGTPLPNRPREAFTITKALDWSTIDWQSYASFKSRYNPGGTQVTVSPSTGKVSRFVWEGVGRLPELNARLRAHFMVRRLKEEVLKDLPPKEYELTYVETTGAILRALRAERLLDIDRDELANNSFSFDGGQVATVRRMMGEAMTPGAIEHCRMVLDGMDDKLVIFAYHQSVIDVLMDGLKHYGVVKIDGRTPHTKRIGGQHSAVETFKHNPDVRVIIIQIITAPGIDGLQDVANQCVFAEPDWVPGNNEQCIDRLHRMGQEGSVLAQFLVAKDSLAEYILSKAIDKAHITHQVLDATPIQKVSQ
jgi:SWI/SNF-related matrix-associated actin-dependent regulator of chromatin subfamily A-like protein 1